jgi:hypothetical protein
MKNAKVINGKDIASTKRNAREEFATLSGCLKALCELDNLTRDNKRVLAYIGVRKGLNNRERSEVARRVYENTPYYWVDGDGLKHPAEKRHTTNEAGERVAYYAPRASWTFAKIIDTARVYVGDRAPELVEIVAQ